MTTSSMTIRSTASLLLAAFALMPLLSGCTEAAKATLKQQNDDRRRGQAQRMLEDRAEMYWEAVRWKDWATAATFLQEADDQRRYLDVNTRPEAKHVNMDDAPVRYTFVSPRTFDTGEVRVQYTEVDASAAVVEPTQQTQQWYKRHAQWWLDPQDTLLKSEPPKQAGAEPARQE